MEEIENVHRNYKGREERTRKFEEVPLISKWCVANAAYQGWCLEHAISSKWYHHVLDFEWLESWTSFCEPNLNPQFHFGINLYSHFLFNRFVYDKDISLLLFWKFKIVNIELWVLKIDKNLWRPRAYDKL